MLRGQVDTGARVIQLFEACGWAYDVRWPKQERLDAAPGRLMAAAGEASGADERSCPSRPRAGATAGPG